MALPIPVPRPDDRPYAELLRTRDTQTGRPVWVLDRVDRDPRDGSPIRVEVAARDNLRAILADALEFERRGGYVNRGGLPR